MKRIFLFLVTNLAVVLVLGIVANLLGVVLNGVPARSGRYGYYNYQSNKDTYADYYGEDGHKQSASHKRGLLGALRRRSAVAGLEPTSQRPPKAETGRRG